MTSAHAQNENLSSQLIGMVNQVIMWAETSLLPCLEPLTAATLQGRAMGLSACG